jgi:hypothetical protein
MMPEVKFPGLILVVDYLFPCIVISCDFEPFLIGFEGNLIIKAESPNSQRTIASKTSPALLMILIIEEDRL